VLALIGDVAVGVADLEQGQDDGLAVISVRNAQRPRPDMDREPRVGAAEAHPIVGVRAGEAEREGSGEQNRFRLHGSVLIQPRSFLLSSYGLRSRHGAEWHPSDVILYAPMGFPQVPVGRKKS